MDGDSSTDGDNYTCMCTRSYITSEYSYSCMPAMRDLSACLFCSELPRQDR